MCGIEVDVEDGRAISVRGDRDHPVSAGYTCAKGRMLPALHADPGRLDTPLVRTSDGALVPAEWEHALADLGDRLHDIATSYGRDSIGFFIGNGFYLDAAGYWAARRLQRRLATKHSYSNVTIDAAGKYRVGELMAGTYSLVPHADPEASLLLLFGTNPVVSHGQTPMFENPVERLRASSRAGEVWVIDPRTTETARLADRHLPIRPGTDHALLAHLVRSLLEEADRDALDRRAIHVDELAAAVAPFTLERVTETTGLPEVDVVALVDTVRRTGRLAALSGTGVTMSPGANAAEWLLWALLVVTDSFDKPGGMWFNPGYIARLDQRDTIPSAPPPEPGPPTQPHIPRLMDEWPAAVIPAEIEAGNLRALVVLGANLVTCLPDTNRALAALAALDVLAVLDVQHTETVELATHVLPNHAQLERSDVSMLNDLFNPVVSTQFTPAVLPQHDGRRAAWWTLARIGHSLGFEILPDGTDPDTATDDDVLALAAGTDLVNGLRDAQRPWAVAPSPVFDWVQGRLPNGRWDLAPGALVDQLGHMLKPPSLVLTPRRQPKRMNGRTIRQGDRPEVLLHPDDAAAAGVRDGDRVEVVSSAGALELAAHLTEAIRPGAASIAHGWAGTNVNVLVDGDLLDPLTGMPGLSGTPVSVRALDEGGVAPID